MKKPSHPPAIIALIVVLIIVAVAGVWIYRHRMQEVPKAPTGPVNDTVYGIVLDSMEVTYGRVGNNQNLSMLLSGREPGNLIDRAARESVPLFDVRKIKAGNTFAWITSKDSNRRDLYFIYEINPIDFIVFDLRDSLKIYRDAKKVTRVVKTAGGTIKTSLWNCFAENNLDVGLGLALSDVYAWVIDFYGLQKGDHFRVIYEEMSVDGRVIGIDRIMAAHFTHSGKVFKAFRFEQNGKGEFFDEQGQSLQRSFLKAPLKFSRISSRFTRSRMHPILRISRPHYGVDYAAPKGTPVVALGSGRVTEAGYKGGYGRFVAIRHNSVYTTTYAHLAGYAKGIRAGVNVSQGQVIGYVGSSGLSTGPHLDFRVYKNGQPTDPLRIESPPEKPVEPVNLVKFREVVTRMEA